MAENSKINNLVVIRLYTAWLTFLSHAGKYTKRYYMARDLELPPGERNPQTEAAMLKLYKSEAGLNGAIQHDLATLPRELLDINAAQIACGLQGFFEPGRDEYLSAIIMGFAMLERHGRERRGYYYRKVRAEMRALSAGKEVTPLSLNQLEEGYKASRARTEKRTAKAAAKNITKQQESSE